MPPPADARAVGLVEALEDRAARSAFAMPIPWSVTETRRRRRRRAARATRTSPPSGLNLTALWTRLTNTWPSRASSPRIVRHAGLDVDGERDALALGEQPEPLRRRPRRAGPRSTSSSSRSWLPPSIRARSSSSLTIWTRWPVSTSIFAIRSRIRAGHVGALGVAGERLGEQADRRQRRPQLVAQVVDELGPDLLEAAELGDVLEHDDELVAGASRRPARRAAAARRRRCAGRSTPRAPSRERRRAAARCARRGRSPSPTARAAGRPARRAGRGRGRWRRADAPGPRRTRAAPTGSRSQHRIVRAGCRPAAGRGRAAGPAAHRPRPRGGASRPGRRGARGEPGDRDRDEGSTRRGSHTRGRSRHRAGAGAGRSRVSAPGGRPARLPRLACGRPGRGRERRDERPRRPAPGTRGGAPSRAPAARPAGGRASPAPARGPPPARRPPRRARRAARRSAAPRPPRGRAPSGHGRSAPSIPCDARTNAASSSRVSAATRSRTRDDARAVGPVPRLVQARVPRPQQPVARAAAERLGEQVVEERRQHELGGDAEQPLAQPDLRPAVGRHAADELRLGVGERGLARPARGTGGPWRGTRSAAAPRRPAGPARPASGAPTRARNRARRSAGSPRTRSTPRRRAARPGGGRRGRPGAARRGTRGRRGAARAALVVTGARPSASASYRARSVGVAQPVVGDVDPLRPVERRVVAARDVRVVALEQRPPGDLDRLGRRVDVDLEPGVEVVVREQAAGHASGRPSGAGGERRAALEERLDVLDRADASSRPSRGS